MSTVLRSRYSAYSLPRRISMRIPRLFVYVLLIAVALVSLFPLYWLFNTALTPANVLTSLTFVIIT